MRVCYVVTYGVRICDKHDKIIGVHVRLRYNVGYGIAIGAHDLGIAICVFFHQ